MEEAFRHHLFHDLKDGWPCRGVVNQVLARLPLILRGCILILLVLAAARPQLYNVSRDVRSPGVDIILCLDTSGSMQALDFKLDNKPVSRLTAVRKVVNDFIKKGRLIGSVLWFLVKRPSHSRP